MKETFIIPSPGGEAQVLIWGRGGKEEGGGSGLSLVVRSFFSSEE